MGRICEHEFELPDPENPDYSHVEYDLYARLGLTIRKNLKQNIYEIVTIRRPRNVHYTSSDLHEIVLIANRLEGETNTVIECGVLCPARKTTKKIGDKKP